jgi:hypothetical protein
MGFLYALSHGHLRRVLRCALYEPDSLFNDYVDYFYPLKVKYEQEGNAIYERMVKIYLNSLYGKFGERRYEEERYDDPWPLEPYRIENYDKETRQRWIETHLFGVTIIQRLQTEGPNSFVAIPAHVTEYARFELFKAIQKAGQGRVFYCDTDSLAIRASDVGIFSADLDETKLGQLSVDKRAHKIRLYGPKDYELDGVRITKGIPKDAKEIEPNTFRYEQFLGSISHIRRGEVTNFITQTVEKVVKGNYEKGNVHQDGSITPYVLGDS